MKKNRAHLWLSAPSFENERLVSPNPVVSDRTFFSGFSPNFWWAERNWLLKTRWDDYRLLYRGGRCCKSSSVDHWWQCRGHEMAFWMHARARALQSSLPINLCATKHAHKASREGVQITRRVTWIVSNDIFLHIGMTSLMGLVFLRFSSQSTL